MLTGKFKKTLDIMNSMVVASGNGWAFDPGNSLSGDRGNFKRLIDIFNNVVEVVDDGGEDASVMNLGDLTSFVGNAAITGNPDVVLHPSIDDGNVGSVIIRSPAATDASDNLDLEIEIVGQQVNIKSPTNNSSSQISFQDWFGRDRLSIKDSAVVISGVDIVFRPPGPGQVKGESGVIYNTSGIPVEFIGGFGGTISGQDGQDGGYSRVQGGSGGTATGGGNTGGLGGDVLLTPGNGGFSLGGATDGDQGQVLITRPEGTLRGDPPTSAPADQVGLRSVDLSAGVTMLGINTEGDPTGAGLPVQDTTIAVDINGTTYYLLASTTAS